MNKEKASVPKGTRDFTPDQMIRRNYIFHTITEIFQRHGFLPIETPAMENLSTLLGKYGEEGDRLLYKILNSGDFLKSLDKADWEDPDPASISMKICNRGLRYDLTVPFARFVVQHRSEIPFPFRRYQIQPVWRADKPQRGRYREFYQCDVDVVGSDSLLNEVEMIQIIDEVFTGLGISITVKLNHRKILAGLAEVVGQPERLTDITVGLDKVQKIGVEKVKQELLSKGIPAASVEKLNPVWDLRGSNTMKLNTMKEFLAGSEMGMQGIRETEQVLDFLKPLDMVSRLEADMTLARGLDYYTGAIIEVVADNMEMGSLCGGGRYDNLTGVFGMEGMSGVGISFGADRIYDVMEHFSLFPDEAVHSTRLLFINFGAREAAYCLDLLKKIRRAGIQAELYPDAVKIKKQMTYAHNRGIPFVALVGEEEMKEGAVALKNMATGDQSKLSLTALISELRR